jgi:hypothetical protein
MWARSALGRGAGARAQERGVALRAVALFRDRGRGLERGLDHDARGRGRGGVLEQVCGDASATSRGAHGAERTHPGTGARSA